MQVILMPVVLQSGMPAVRTVHVSVPFVDLMVAHFN